MPDDVVEHDGAGGHPDHQDSNHQSKITDTRGDERFFRGFGGGIALEPVTNEQVGGETHQLPENEHHHEIVREHDAEHGKHEERERGEVAGFAGIVAHVA